MEECQHLSALKAAVLNAYRKTVFVCACKEFVKAAMKAIKLKSNRKINLFIRVFIASI
jgi:hypothetical protein